MISEIEPPHTAAAFAAMRELRPHWDDADAFVRQVDELQRPAGYRLVGAFGSDEARADAVAGFRLVDNLAWGRHLYVDDLSTRASARRTGLGRRLLGWLHEEAVRLGCAEVHLDSGVGPARHDAHRLYLGARYSISAHHFVRAVKAQTHER